VNATDLQDCLEPPRAYHGQSRRASIRARPEDFRVQEILGFEPSGIGEHLYLELRKRNANTHWVAEQIARNFGLRTEDVGYAGLKDRHAVSTQWFSVRDPVAELEPGSMAIAGVEVLRWGRHPRKLRPGSHAGNRFRLVMRALAMDDELGARLELIGRLGVPNYFGPQRFGHDGQTLRQAIEWLEQGRPRLPRFKHGLYLSAARALLFNRVLTARVRHETWRTPLVGDVLAQALPTGPLWGRGRSATSGEALVVERDALAGTETVCEALEHVGLRQERRAMVLRPKDLSHEAAGDGAVSVSFALPPGAYATVVLREIADLEDLGASGPQSRGRRVA
jgi:tRNA pseudouridine13 synthase